MAPESAHHRLATVLCLLLSCALMLLVALPALAANPAIRLRDPQIFVSPASARPGATLHVSGHDLVPGDELALDLLRLDRPTPLTMVTVSSDGTFRQDVVLPADTLPGNWLIRAMDDPQATIEYAALVVAPPITLNLSPTQGPPGTVVTVDVGNLFPGTLQIDYDGLPILGPLSVGGESYQGQFTVPRDRPDPLGSTAPVTLTHRLNGQMVGTASATFASEREPATPIYTFTQVVLPAEPLAAGEAFSIEGVLDPAPEGDLGAYDIVALWKRDGKVLPISSEPATVGPTGTFRVSARMPDLLSGDPVSPADAAQIGLVLQAPDAHYRPILAANNMSIVPEAQITVRVLAEDTLLPIEGAIVRILPAPDLHVGDEAEAVADSQLRQWTDDQGFTSYIEADELRFCDSSLGELVDDSGYAQMVFDPWSPIVNPAFYQDWLSTDRYGYGEHATVAQPMAALSALDVQPASEDELSYVVVVDAIEQGYAEVDENGWPLVTSRLLLYNTQTAQWRTSAGSMSMPFEIILPPIAEPEKVPAMAIWLRVGWGGIDIHGEDLPGPLISLQQASQDPDIALGAFEPVTVLFRLWPHENARVVSARLSIDGADWGPFTVISSTACSGYQLSTTYDYTCEVPPTVLSPGDHTFTAHVQTKGGRTIVVDRVATFDPPPAWFLQPIYRNRSVECSCEYIYWEEAYRCDCRFAGETLPSGQTTSQLFAEDIPGKGDIRMGNQDNRAGADSKLSESVVAKGFNRRSYSGGVRSMALNTDGVYQPTNKPSAGSTVTFGDGPIPIVSTGRIPVYRDMWGIWPIASARFGCDIWFNANLRYDGTVQITPSGSSTTLTVTPSASVGLDIWIDVSAICGLVKAEVHALPTIGMAMPVTLVDGAMYDTANCFRARLDVSYYSRVGCCKCGVCKKKSGTKNAFDYAHPDGCYVQLSAEPSDDPVPPEHANPTLAADGSGEMMTLWRSQDGQILSSLYQPSSGDWSDPTTVASGIAVEDPALAYYRPQKALALWTDTSLDSTAFASATISEAIRSQHVLYSFWDGKTATWGAPQSLTSASTGEGQIAVARDPDSESVTAVWMRDVGGDITRRQFRLFYATFQDGFWSAVHPVDPGSSACDSQPAIAYQNGVPLVAWIRDADRDLGTLDDRRLALCLLDGAAEVVVPGDIPAGVVECDLAVTSYGQPRLAYTLAGDAGLIDNRHTLNTASAAAPGAAWAVHALTDSHGRAIRAQQPRLTLDASDIGTVTFRGMGFGPLPGGQYAVYQEPIGMERALGELTQVETQFAGQGRDPSYLSNDGAVYWQPTALYDPLSQATFAVAVQGATASPAGGPARLVAEEEPIVFAAAARLPDLIVEGLQVYEQAARPEPLLKVDVRLRNDGASIGPRGMFPIAVVANWDEGPGLGADAGASSLTALGAGQSMTLTLDLSRPSEGLDVPRTLIVTANPYQTRSERTAENNQASVVVGALSPPEGLQATVRPGSRKVFLSWVVPDDDRIAGHIIERAPRGGRYERVGATFGATWLDLGSDLEEGWYEYRVSAYTALGLQSPPSEPILVEIMGQEALYVPLVLNEPTVR